MPNVQKVPLAKFNAGLELLFRSCYVRALRSTAFFGLPLSYRGYCLFFFSVPRSLEVNSRNKRELRDVFMCASARTQSLEIHEIYSDMMYRASLLK